MCWPNKGDLCVLPELPAVAYGGTTWNLSYEEVKCKGPLISFRVSTAFTAIGKKPKMAGSLVVVSVKDSGIIQSLPLTMIIRSVVKNASPHSSMISYLAYS